MWVEEGMPFAEPSNASTTSHWPLGERPPGNPFAFAGGSWYVPWSWMELRVAPVCGSVSIREEEKTAELHARYGAWYPVG